jgi:carboxyl-terminal processing protease
LPEAFLAATSNSAVILQTGRRKVGYVHLWFGGFDSDLILSNIVQGKFKGQVDGLILDLRDGFGAAWWNHLDPFYPDRNEYFISTTISRDGSRETLKPELLRNPEHFSGPMVVLINEDVRSGKEALAYQFKKTKRAFLIGTRTAGAFVAGKGFFTEEDQGYLLYLAVKGVLLDGNVIEGQGIVPDQEVAYPLDKVLTKDPQLEAALEHLGS